MAFTNLGGLRAVCWDGEKRCKSLPANFSIFFRTRRQQADLGLRIL